MIRVWNLDSGQLVYELASPAAKVLCMVLCRADLLATAGSDNTIRLWDLKERRLLQRLEGHTGSVATLACEGDVLVSGSFDTTVRVWDLRFLHGSDPQARYHRVNRDALR